MLFSERSLGIEKCFRLRIGFLFYVHTSLGIVVIHVTYNSVIQGVELSMHSLQLKQCLAISDEHVRWLSVIVLFQNDLTTLFRNIFRKFILLEQELAALCASPLLELLRFV